MNELFKVKAEPCADYVEDLSAYVDGEIGRDEVKLEPDLHRTREAMHPDLSRLVRHMGECAGCHDYTNALRQLSELNRSAAICPDPRDEHTALADFEHDEATAGCVDPSRLFASIACNLVEEKREALARLFYEIGKAYALAGNRALQEKRRQSVAYASRPLSLRGTEARARRELKNVEALEMQMDQKHEGAQALRAGSGLLLRRSRQLFGSSRRGSAALTRARRFLEESLALDSTLDEARLYLGFRHAVVGRPDRARIQFRKVHLEGRTSLLRLLASQSLGRLYAEGGDYHRAIECYEEVVSSGEALEAAELFPSFLNLAVNYAKAGQVDKSTETFVDIARLFSDRLPRIRELLARKTFFQALLDKNLTLKWTLASRAPALFAA